MKLFEAKPCKSKSLSVRRPNREQLLEIRKGAFDYDILIEQAEQKLKAIDAAFDTCSLPDEPDFLKGSRAGAHHGCWAHLLMGEDRVVGVEYRSVPPSVHATDHCEEIFHTCAQ